MVIDMEKRRTKKDIVKMLLRNNELAEKDEEELLASSCSFISVNKLCKFWFVSIFVDGTKEKSAFEARTAVPWESNKVHLNTKQNIFFFINKLLNK